MEPAGSTPRAREPVGESARAILEGALREHGARLLAAVTRLLPDADEARDAFQDGMLAAWKAMPKFEGRSQVSTWLHRIVINHALMRIRQRTRTDEKSLDDLLPSFTDYGHFRVAPMRWGEDPGARMQRRELRDAVQTCIARIPESTRIPLVLRDIEGLEVGEVAEVLSISANAVRIRVHRGRQMLKALLEPHLVEGAS